MTKKNKKKRGTKKEDVVSGSSMSHPVSGDGQEQQPSTSEGQGSEKRHPQSSGVSKSGESATRELAREGFQGQGQGIVVSSSSGQQQRQMSMQGERQVSELKKGSSSSTSKQTGGQGTADVQVKGTSSNWKPFPNTQKEVVLYQRPKEPAKWALKRIPVSVNYFRMEGIPKIIYQYDVQCALIRAGQGQGEPQQQRRVPKDLTEELLKWLVTNLKVESGHQAIATNFSNFLYTTRKLEDLRIPLQYEFPVAKLKQAGIISEDDADEQDTSVYKVTIQFANCGETGGIIDTKPIISYLAEHGNLKGITLAPNLAQTFEAAFNAFIRGVPHPQIPFISVGRSSTIVPWDTEGKALGEGLTAWKGISMNVVMGWKPYLNLEITNTAFVTGVEVLDALKEVLNCRDVEELGDVSGLDPHKLEKARSYLKTIKVQYKVKGKKFTKTVRDVFDFGADHPNTIFEWEGKQVTVFEYFNRRYQANLRFRDGLLLMTSNNAKIPAELCTIKDGQSVNRRLTGKQTDNMIKFARKTPQKHHDDIQRKFGMCGFKKNPMLNELGVGFPDQGMLRIENARVLVPPSIKYGDVGNQVGQRITPEHGAWKIFGPQNLIFYRNPNKITKWGVLVVGCSFKLDKNRNHNYLKRFIKLLSDEGGKKGVVIEGDPIEKFDADPIEEFDADPIEEFDADPIEEFDADPIEEFDADPIEEFDADPIEELDGGCRNFDDAALKNLKILGKHFAEFKKAGCQFVLVVIPGKGDPLYGHVKHAAEIDVGILTQCVQLKSIFGPPPRFPGPSVSLVQNVLLKLNMKLGGINHVVMPPLNTNLAKQFCTLLMDCPVLVLGGDVTHPPPGSKKLLVEGEQEPYAPSYAAVTGSLDKTCMPYMTEVRAQRKAGAGAAEVIQDMENIVLNMLLRFYETSGETALPLKIIYFRDGVGRGQFQEVLFKEMMAIRRACAGIPKSMVESVMGKGTVYEPPITFLTVQKRHKTRIFWPDGKNAIKNAPAGTVVDTDIVYPGFFMCSHEGSLGTSRPCQYEPLWDDSNFSMDEIQSIAYTLCYMFARCTKSVKMPAPTYYAHLAADRAKKLCEGFENKMGEASIGNLNAMLARDQGFCKLHPMHFI